LILPGLVGASAKGSEIALRYRQHRRRWVL